MTIYDEEWLAYRGRIDFLIFAARLCLDWLSQRVQDGVTAVVQLARNPIHQSSGWHAPPLTRFPLLDQVLHELSLRFLFSVKGAGRLVIHLRLASRFALPRAAILILILVFVFFDQQS